MQTSIPPLILGTMTFGDTADEASATDLVGAALDADIAWFDTGNSHSDGRCEEIVGRILEGRDDVTIATKVGQAQSLVGTESLLSRRFEDEYEEYAVSTGLPTVIYNPLAGGLLTGRYRRDADAGSGRFGDARNAKVYRARYWDERMFAAVDALTAIADDAGIGLAEFALRWSIGRPAVQSVLLGGSRVAHLRENIEAFGRGPLPADVSAAADAVGDDLRGPMPAYNR